MKKFILILIILILIILFFVLSYFCVQDINATDAKEYITKTYDLNKYKVITLKTTEYIYNEDVNCESEWFKTCTDDKNLYKKIIFKHNNREIIVYEYNDGTFSDNFNE